VKAVGATVGVYWPGITDEQRDLAPGFWNDCKAWGDWMAEREGHPDVLKTLRQIGADALLTHMTDGMEEDEVRWVSPEELEGAAARLRDLVLAEDAKVRRILETYALCGPPGEQPVGKDFAQDLIDVAQIARYARGQGVAKMTLEVNW
jgi:hypothetical protein